jgi:type IV pilus assembly protein PilW
MHSLRHFKHRQRGLTLIEMAIAMTIGLFLVAGVATMMSGTRATLTAQTDLAQLQDSERLAMTVMTDVIQAAGYYPDPKTYSTSDLAIAAPFTQAGQGVFGTSTTSGPDTLTIRYLTVQGDQTLNCLGGQNQTLGTPYIFVNTFSLSAQGELQCAFGANPPVVLVSGLQNMVIWYGVNTGTAVDPTRVDKYVRASAVTDWTKVYSVKVQLTFANPTNAAAPIQLTRIINVMNSA